LKLREKKRRIEDYYFSIFKVSSTHRNRIIELKKNTILKIKIYCRPTNPIIIAAMNAPIT